MTSPGAGAPTPADVATLDLKGLKCPLPALKTRKALSRMAAGQRVSVICTDPMAGIDIPHLLRETGDVLEDQQKGEGTLTFLVRKV
ncbi:MAG: sulfurtransferase TusA family protein [Phreatobacter sp.]|uniref:sulfurtransferase TusA family protein n=1 Tax=Phreatobacter sp. TaxID=1966341 RepID=UPI004035657C